MSTQILVLSEEFIKRIFVGLGEMPSKFSHNVILEIEAQLKAAENEAHRVVALVEAPLNALKAKVAADAAKAKATVAPVVSEVKTVVADVKAEPAAVEAVVAAVEKAV
jgi:hypothetical protein